VWFLDLTGYTRLTEERGDEAAAELAARLAGLVGSHGLPPAHVGIHAGPVVFWEGDYFGRTVNLAARIAEYARPGEVLVSQEVVDAADKGPVTFTEIGPVELKGVPGALRLHTARRDA
jgi:adenylate cyclase